MNWLSLFATLLLITQTPVPTTGQAPNGTAANCQDNNAATDGGKCPTLPVSPTSKIIGTPTGKTETDKTADYDDQPAINITNPAPVPGPWHWYEQIAWAFNITLTITGIVAVVYARRTVAAAKDSAEAALRSVQAVIASERPWMIVDVRPTRVGSVEMTYEFFCSNEGKTPGRILDCKEGFCFVTAPDDLAIKDTDYHPVVMPVPSLKANKQVFSVRLINPDQMWKDRKIKTSEKFIVVFGYVLYEDTFPSGKDGIFGKHETHWCFAYHPDGSRVFTPSGPNE